MMERRAFIRRIAGLVVVAASSPAELLQSITVAPKLHYLNSEEYAAAMLQILQSQLAVGRLVSKLGIPSQVMSGESLTVEVRRPKRFSI